MKLFISTIIMCTLSYSSTMGQSLELETVDINERVMALLKFPADNNQSSNTIKVVAGLNSLSETELTSWGSSYVATSGYLGYGGLTNRQNGLIIRAASQVGNIRFLTGGTNVLNNTRVRINESGNVAIGNQNPFSKLHVQNGDVFISEISKGVIMKSPNGNCWRLQVSNSGTPSFTSTSCPDAQN